MTGRSKLKLVAAVVAFPLLVFGLPLLTVLWIGPARTDALVGMLGAAPRGPAAGHGHPAGREVPVFSLVDQERRTVTNRDLRGHVWVASFFISRCAGSCPMTSSKMAKLQEQVAHGDVKLASFSMSPEY